MKTLKSDTLPLYLPTSDYQNHESY